jgi:hypothetical protein
MPVKSKDQLAYLAIHRPEVLRKWKKDHGSLYEEGKSYSDLPKDLPDKKSQTKRAFELVEADPSPGAYSEKKTQNEVNYRAGKPGRSCAVCVNFVPSSGCHIVEGIIKPEGSCMLFEENTIKTGELKRLYRIRQGQTLYKVAAASQSVGASMATLLDKEIEENKQLRSELQARDTGAGPPPPGMSGPVPPPPAGPPPMPPEGMPPEGMPPGRNAS